MPASLMPGTGTILALNSGSSSLKLGCYTPAADAQQGEQLLLTGTAEGIGRGEGKLRLTAPDGTTLLEQGHLCESQEQAFDRLAAALAPHLPAPPVAIGHRVVHGGPKLREHQRITPAVLADLQAATEFAPLHIPQALALIRKTAQSFPQIPQFACFDTTFHRTMPDVATHLPLPARLFAQGVQRYGFHGLSCESVVRRLGPQPPQRLIICHLGSGSSVTAVRDGRSLDTSMGLSPTGGIPMSTRSGDLDPGVLLYLLRTEKPTPDALEHMLDHDSGLAGLSGGESDMQELLKRTATPNPPATQNPQNLQAALAALAVDAFCTGVLKAIGSYLALLGGLDLLVFTGGIGEHSQDIRNRILDRLSPLGLGQNGGPTPIRVLGAQEELEIAYHCRRLLGI